MNRLEQLHQFLEEDPNDPFTSYALALEYQKSDRYKAKELFDQLMTNHSHYIPSYYHAGKLYLELDQKENGLKIFQLGIIEARQQSDLKALHELQAAYHEAIIDY